MQKQSYFHRHNTILSYAWSFFKGNKDLLWLPIVNMIMVSLIYLCLILVPPLVAWKQISLTSISLMLFLLFVTMILFKAVFRGALYACVVTRLQSKPMTVMEGVAEVLECLPSLFIYTLFDSIVGKLCSLFEDSHDLISDAIFLLLSASWKLSTAFCIPLILLEKKGPLSSIRSSVNFCSRTIESTIPLKYEIVFLCGMSCAANNCYSSFSPCALGTWLYYWLCKVSSPGQYAKPSFSLCRLIIVKSDA